MKNLHTWRRSRLHWCTVWSGALSSVSCFPPRLLLFFLSAGFVFLVISVSLYSLFFIISGFSPDFCLFIPLSFFSVRPSGFSLGFFPPFFFVFLLWFLLWSSPGMLCFWCSCCWRWSCGAATEDEVEGVLQEYTSLPFCFSLIFLFVMAFLWLL